MSDSSDTPNTPEKGAGDSSNRRGFMFKIGAGLMGVGGLLISAPILGYILAPSVIDWKKRRSWIDLGPLEDFPVGKTHLAVYKNPIHGPTVGLADQIPCWVRRTSTSEFQIFYINCAHLGCPVHWLEEPKLFMCPCHAVSTTRTAHGLRVHRHADSSSTTGRSFVASSTSTAVRCPTSRFRASFPNRKSRRR